MLSLSLQIVAVKMLPGQVTSGHRESNETFVDGIEICKYFRLPTTIAKVAYLESGWSKLLWGKSLKLWLCPEPDYKSFLVGLVGVVDGVWFSKEFWLLLRSLFKNVNHWEKVKLVPDRAQGIPIAVGISFQHSASNGSRTKKPKRERERERDEKWSYILCSSLLGYRVIQTLVDKENTPGTRAAITREPDTVPWQPSAIFHNIYFNLNILYLFCRYWRSIKVLLKTIQQCRWRQIGKSLL